MANRRTTFDKLNRERARKAKAAAKRDRRMEKGDVSPTPDGAVAVARDEDVHQSTAELLATIELIHRQFEANQISVEEFEERKAALLTRLPID